MKNKLYRLTKLSDDVFNGKHPNGILADMYWDGHINSKPKVGERFHFGNHLDHPRNHLWTSTVKELLNDNKFKTRNSTYQLKEL